MRLSALVPLAALLVVLPLARADLKWANSVANPRSDVVLLSFGDAELSISALYRGAAADPTPAPTFSASPLYTVADPVIEPAGDSYYNYTFTVSFSAGVGVTSYTLQIGSDNLQGTFTVAGFVIKSGGSIVSGDGNSGASVGQGGTFDFDVDAVGVDGTTPDLSSVTIDPRSSDGQVYMEEVDTTRTAFSAGKFTLAIGKFRVGRGAFVLMLDAPGIVSGGESFETVLHVTQATTPIPPCVVEGPDLLSRSGVVEASMYNVLSPPKTTAVTDITLSVGGKSVPFDNGLSSLVLPTSKVVFKDVSGTGAATIQCDGVDAVVVSGGVEVTTPLIVVPTGAPQPLAKDTLLKPAPSSSVQALVTSVVRVIDSDPSTLTAADAEDILDEYCSTLPSTSCVVTNVTSGSARLQLAALVDEEDKALDRVKDSFKSCTFQTNTGYACDKLELEGTSVVSASAVAGAAGAAGLATWTIILISCVGAFGLIAVAALTLWAVHRRSSQLSESSYSSSGPLGVPDPSDLLYEQSIIRDVYGRGEMGGPTLQAALRSERVAAMREDVPRPPSDATGFSRRRSSGDDVSSTYSM